MLPFSFLAGQCTMGLLLLLPLAERGWLLWIPALIFLRGWERLAFALGCAWQKYWAPDAFAPMPSFFWFLGSAETEADPIPIFFKDGALDRLADGLAQQAEDFFLAWDPDWGLWFLRFGFGLKLEGGDDWPRIYQELGLLHVLVVSGAHFSFIGGLCQTLLGSPGRIGYAMRLLSFPAWLGWMTATRMMVTVLITLFALIVGFNPPCQRAWLSLLLGLWLPLIGAPLDDMRRDRWVFTVQALCFPGSFLSLSNALSWSAYTMVRYLKPWPKAWQRRLLPAVEGPLIAVNLSYFGLFSPWGLCLNTLLQPVWHIVLGCGLLYWIWPQAWIGEGLQHMLRLLHEGILFVHEHGQQNGPVQWEGRGPWGALGRSILWCAASWTFFRLWRRREDAC
ncbi:MAG TPA: ComEC/Rec2 family competence protein [Oligoflexus sp.]|uniref:ComEC/Rec2 family competence protein n=1 Tax=Oligoflexus sp. TaxID=1971216 RepID=UPI002D524DC0|nr:ComEC/Rec2 family competence protein [Oligoflexus sp.]HYX38073.1 ComEC/Rec2 family competence protein [Oligoflexus sp.]